MEDSFAWFATRWGRLARLLIPALLILFLAVLWFVGPIWLGVFWTGLPSDTRRGIARGFLVSVLVGYLTTLVLAPLAGLGAFSLILRARRRREKRPLAARVLLLSVSVLVGLGILEVAAWRFGVWARMPRPLLSLPPVATKETIAKAKAHYDLSALREDPSDLIVLVLGESSAEGQPFQPTLSIGQILAWQLERAMPSRVVRVRMMATGGVPLANVLGQVALQTERPDLVVLYSGHNEFQSRWGWSRVVNYYWDDIIVRRRNGLADSIGDWTPLTEMIRGAVERQSIDRQPTPREVRAAVERPVCEPRVRANVCALFERELDIVAAWCEGVGALPIFVVPAGNDVGFEPSRSIMSPGTLLDGRAAFTRDFAAARELEETHPEDAPAAYRVLIARQPGFAEARYRLALLLQGRGDIDAAREQFALARDLDGLPMRCPSEFQATYAAIATRHDVVLIDATERLTALSPTKLLDDHVFHDAQHPTFRAYLDLSQAALDEIYGRGALGLPRGAAPRIDPEECATHFGMDAEHWAVACEHAASFWGRLAMVRYDSSERRTKEDRFVEAARLIRDGVPPESAAIPGLGVKPEGFP